MKYMEVIRDLANRQQGQAFLHYDVPSRTMRQTRPRMRWDPIPTELWVQSATASNSNRNRFQQRGPTGPYNFSRPNANAQANPQFPRYVCWAFNRGGSCTRTDCRYQHVCAKCRGAHPATSCNSASGPHNPVYNLGSIAPMLFMYLYRDYVQIRFYFQIHSDSIFFYIYNIFSL